jgi:tRNA(Ile)-lysidine synthase
MALTYLCKQLELSRPEDGLTFTAFIVDHKARPESSREARTVAMWLAKMGMVICFM